MPASVSILIRSTGTRPVLLRQAIESVLAQSWRPLEIVLVEDGGTRLARIPHDYAGQPGVSFVYASCNGGRSVAGNTAMAAATGEMLGFLDDDDWIEPHHVATLVERLETDTGAVAAFALAQEVSVDVSGRKTGRRIVGHLPFSRPRLWQSNVFSIQSRLFRRAASEISGGLDPDLNALEDWDFWLRLSAVGDFTGIDQVTSAFRVPASRAVLRQRARDHEVALARVVEKNRHLKAVTGFGEVRALEQEMRNRLDEVAGVRWCLGRIWRRLRWGR